jgi:hypothetical protein
MSDQTARPTILSTQMVQRAVNDPGFFSVMPEFMPLKATLAAARAAIKSAETGRGCSSCRKRRVFAGVFSEFLRTARGLPADRIEALKGYLGVSGLMASVIDPATRRAVLIRM